MTNPDVVLFSGVVKQLIGKDTSSDPDNWHAMNPWWGQCAVVALLVQDVFGGTLLNAKVGPGKISHYWNLLPTGEVDLTFEQFFQSLPESFYYASGFLADITDKKQREYVLSFPTTKARYEILKGRFDAYVEKVVEQVAIELGQGFPGVEKTS